MCFGNFSIELYLLTSKKTRSTVSKSAKNHVTNACSLCLFLKKENLTFTLFHV